MKRKYALLLLAAAALTLTQASCATFVAPSAFMPTNDDLKDALGSTWLAFEVGGVVEEAPPLLVRASLGYMSKSRNETNALADLTAEADFITLRAAAMYLFPKTGDRKTDGFYFGGGLSAYSWEGGVKGQILGLPVEDYDDSNDVGLLLMVGYRHALKEGDIGFFGEVLYEYVKSNSDELDEELGEQLGGFSFVMGIFFR